MRILLLLSGANRNAKRSRFEVGANVGTIKPLCRGADHSAVRMSSCRYYEPAVNDMHNTWMSARAPEEDGLGGQTPPLYILVPKQNAVLMVFETFMTKCICKEKRFPQSVCLKQHIYRPRIYSHEPIFQSHSTQCCPAALVYIAVTWEGVVRKEKLLVCVFV